MEEEKLIKEQWDKLPQNLQRAINALPWKALVQEVGKANTLDAEQVVALERETMFVLYAFESPVDYAQNVIKEVGVSEDAAYAIAESVADKIFDPIWKKAGSEEEKPEANLPMVEAGETVHSVPHVEGPYRPEEKPRVPTPDYRYPDGVDPYREPLH